jgi:putative endonuclease
VEKRYGVYMPASQRNDTLYTGAATDLAPRIDEHRHGAVAGFAREHAVHLLVWFEEHATPMGRVTCERQVKK